MSSNKNFISFIILMILLFGNIFNEPGPNSNLGYDYKREPEPNERGKNDNNPDYKDHNNMINNNNKKEDENKRHFDDKQNDDKQNIIAELRKKNNDIIKINRDSKNKLQKYNLFYTIMVVINVILALIIITFIIYKFYYYINKKRNNNNYAVSIANNNSQIIQEISNKEKGKSIYKSNLIIERINERPIIEFEPNNENQNEAPAIRNFNENKTIN